MRRILLGLTALAMLAAFESPARAEGGPFGLGIILGSPTGVSAKLYLNKKNAVDAAVGFSLLGGSGIHVHADYLWHPIMLTADDAFYLPLYVGIGGRVWEHNRKSNDDDFHLGVRGVVGILFDFRSVPIDVFLEAALVVDVLVDDDHGRIGVNAGLGARYYF